MGNTETVELIPRLKKAGCTRETLDIPRRPKRSGPTKKTIKPVTNSELTPAVALFFPSLENPVADLEGIYESGFSHIFRGSMREGNGHLDVAVKIMKYEDLESAPETVSAFLREAAIHHEISQHPAGSGLPRVTKVYENGVIRGTYLVGEGSEAMELDMHYMLIEFLKGADVEEVLADPSIGLGEKKRIMTHIAQGMMVTHAAGYVHGDIKGKNAVYCPETGVVKLTDFGVARRKGEFSLNVAGTLRYMAPESVFPNVADHRQDIFSFGVMLYEAFEGRHPYAGDAESGEIAATLRNNLILPSDREHLDSGLARIALKCLHKEPEKRYAHAEQVVRELEKL